MAAPTSAASSFVRRAVLAVLLLQCLGGSLFVPVAHAVDEAGRLLQVGDYAGAVTLLRSEQARNPHSARLQLELGIALLKTGDAAAALTELYVARQLQPRNRATLYFMGSAAELAGDSALALDAYRACLADGDPSLGPVRARETALQMAVIRHEMVQALEREPRMKLDEIPSNAVAVSGFVLPERGDSLRPISRGLSALLRSDLCKLPQLRVVEPERLSLLLELRAERWGSSDDFAVDAATAPRLGRLLGARRFIQGEMRSPAPGRLELRVSVIQAQEGKPDWIGEPIQGSTTEIMDLEKTLVFQILGPLGVRVGPVTERAIRVPATRSLGAFIAWSRGLDFESAGLRDSAIAAYREASWLDPRFQLARERLEILSDAKQLAELDQVLLFEAVGGEPARRVRLGIDLRERSADALGFGPTTGTPVVPGGSTRVDEATRIGTHQPLPDFPGPPKPAPGGRPR